MNLSITASGLSELTAKLSRIAGGGLAQGLSKAGDDAANLTLEALRANTPVDTGNLRDSMYVDKIENLIFIGPDIFAAPYAPFVEYGFHHWISGKFIPGQHYLERTSIEMRSTIIDAFQSVIREFLT